MGKKLVATTLSLLLTGYCAGPGSYQALAARLAQRGAGNPVRPPALSGYPVLSGRQALPNRGPGSPFTQVPAFPADYITGPAGLTASPELPAPPAVKLLSQPSELEALGGQAPAESVQQAAADDFSRRLGRQERPLALGKESLPAQEAQVPGISVGGSRAPGLQKAAGRRSGPKAAASFEEARVESGPAERKSAAFFLKLTAFFALGGLALQAAAATVGAWFDPLQIALTGLGLASLTVSGVSAASALADLARFGMAVFRGQGAKPEDLAQAVHALALQHPELVGVEERLGAYRPRGWWDLSFGLTVGGKILVRPELSASPLLLYRVLLHELHHLGQASSRGPPGLGGIARRLLAELGARAAENKAGRAPRDLSASNPKIPLLERILRKSQLSLDLGRPYEVLLINPSSKQLEDPALYKAFSQGQARVQSISTPSAKEPLAKKENQGRFKAVVLGRASEALPAAGSIQWRRLEAGLKQLDSLYLLATGRRTAADSGFKEGSDEAHRYQELVALAARMPRGDKKAADNLERLVKQFWSRLAGEKLKGMALTDLLEALYQGMAHKGMAFLSFGPQDPGAEVWEKLARFWEAPDGGQFRVARVDLEDGSHILVLRKIEARVGLWMRPLNGTIKASVPDAARSEESRRAAREALAAAGFKDQLDKFEQIGVEVQQVFGEDVSRQEIYVSVPRRNAGALRQFVIGQSVQIQPSQTDFLPHLMEAPGLHNVPQAWRMGVTGAGGEILWIDTGVDKTHEDLAGFIEVLDLVHEGWEDWLGHGTHVAGISISRHRLFTGLARLARGLMAKVFGREAPGAADGNIMGAGTIGFQRGVHVISLSLGSRGYADSNLALFFSELTLKRNANGDWVIVVASAGNSGPFDRSGSQPATGRRVISTAAAAKSLDDGEPEIAFYSSVGPSVYRRYYLSRVGLFPKITGTGGDVTTKPGSPRTYEKGVGSAKSKDMPARPDDAPEGRHTFMSGTSMAAPLIAAIVLLIRLGVVMARVLRPRAARARNPVEEDPPLAVEAILMRTARDMGVPPWFQGAGLADAWAALKLVFSSVGDSLRWQWLGRLKALMDLEEKVYSQVERPETSERTRFEDGRWIGAPPSEGLGETVLERKKAGDAAYAEAVKRFNVARREAVPVLLKALEDPVWLVRFQAALVLYNLKSPEAAMALAQAALQDEDRRARRMAFLALAETPAPGVDSLLQQASTFDDWETGVYAAYALARHGDPAGIGRLVPETAHPDKKARFTAVWLLGQLGTQLQGMHAELLSSKVAEQAERGNIRHLAAAALANVAEANPQALFAPADPKAPVSDSNPLLLSRKVIEYLLGSIGPRNIALTRTVAKFFPVALRSKAVAQGLRESPLKESVTAFVLENRAAVGRPGALGELVALLARALDIPLESPTPVMDASGHGVAGVDPAMGPLDLLIEPGTSGAAPDAEVLGRFGAALRGAFSLAGCWWVSVPEHKVFALTWELERRGFQARRARPQYPMSRRPAVSAAEPGVVLDLEASSWEIPADLSLVKLRAGRGVSEARVMAALEHVHALAHDPLQEPVLIVSELSGPPATGEGPLERLMNRLVLRNVGVVAPAGNDGPFPDGVLSPGDAGLPVAVAAASRDSLAFYSSRGGQALWAEVVDDSPLAGLAPGASSGTGVAAARSAEKLSALTGSWAKALAAQGRRLPDGYFLYMAERVQETLQALAGAGKGGEAPGLFGDQARVQDLLHEKSGKPEAVEEEASALMESARHRFGPKPALPRVRTAWDMAWEAVARFLGLIPRLEEGSLFEQAAVAVLAENPAAAPAPGPREPALSELKQVLSDGVMSPGGPIEPFDFRKKDGSWSRARSAGLEGFLYSKLELQVESQSGPSLDQLEDYFPYLEALLSPFEWAKPLWERLEAVRLSGLEPEAKSAALDRELILSVGEMRRKVEALDPALWIRESSVYMILARAFNRLKPGLSFFDSLDEEALRKIAETTGSDTIWLLDIFEIGAISGHPHGGPWGTGGGSPYAVRGYKPKKSLGGEEGFKRLAQRIHRLGLRVGVDRIPNHASLDSDELKEEPQNSLHIVPPQQLSNEEIMAAVPRDHGGPIFHLIHADNYPENGRRVRKKILVHYPMADAGQDERGRPKYDMWIDMFQRDFSRLSTWAWEVKENRRVFSDWGVDLARLDMVYEVLAARFFERWAKILALEFEGSSGWVRSELGRLMLDFRERSKALAGREFLSELLADARALKPAAASLGELYSHETEFGRTGASGAYNKNDHDLRLGQQGLYDALVSRDAIRIRMALKNVAFRLWQRGGHAMVNFIGTHDGGEGNPVDKFGRFFKAAALSALLFRPILVYNGLEQGVGQKDNLLADPADLAKSVDLAKAIPFDIPARLNWDKADPELQGFLRVLFSKSRDYRRVLSSGAMDVLDPDRDSPIVAWSAAGTDEAGRRRVLIGAANFAETGAAAKLRFASPLGVFGAFRPEPGKTYRLRDAAGSGAAPAVLEFSGEDLASGLELSLEGAGVRLFEVEALEPGAPPAGPPATLQAGAEPDKASASGAVAEIPALAPAPEAAKSRWGLWVDRLVFLACVPFLLLQWPQIIANFGFLDSDPSKIAILPWIGYSTGILANSNLWGYHLDGKRHAVAFVQALGVVTSSVVLWQIFTAGFMPAIAMTAMAALIAASVLINVARWIGMLPDALWSQWGGLSKLLGLFALPMGFSVTFNLMDTAPWQVLGASLVFALLGAWMMVREAGGRAPTDLGGGPRANGSRRRHFLANGLGHTSAPYVAGGRLPLLLAGPWKVLGAWLGTLLFIFLPIPQLVNNFSHPERIGGIAIGTLLLSTFGNLLEVTGAMQYRSQIWFVGSFWAVAVGGWGVLLSVFLFGAVSPLVFFGYTAAVAAYLTWLVLKLKRERQARSALDVLRFIVLGDKK